MLRYEASNRLVHRPTVSFAALRMTKLVPFVMLRYEASNRLVHRLTVPSLRSG
jgi:hypothetical protein